MTERPDGAPGRPARMVYALIVGAFLVTIVVAVFAYRDARPMPQRGTAQLPSQAAEGAGVPKP